MNCLVLLPRAAHPGRAGDTVRGPRRRAPCSFGSIFSSTFSSSCSTFSSCNPPSPAADPGRCSLDPGCRGAREGWWHRRTRFWKTSSGAPVVRRVTVRTPLHLHPAHPRPPSTSSHPSPEGGGGYGRPFPVASGTSWTCCEVGVGKSGRRKVCCSPSPEVLTPLPPVQSREQRVGRRYSWRIELSLLRDVFLLHLSTTFPPPTPRLK